MPFRMFPRATAAGLVAAALGHTAVAQDAPPPTAPMPRVKEAGRTRVEISLGFNSTSGLTGSITITHTEPAPVSAAPQPTPVAAGWPARMDGPCCVYPTLPPITSGAYKGPAVWGRDGVPVLLSSPLTSPGVPSVPVADIIRAGNPPASSPLLPAGPPQPVVMPRPVAILRATPVVIQAGYGAPVPARELFMPPPPPLPVPLPVPTGANPWRNAPKDMPEDTAVNAPSVKQVIPGGHR